VAKFELNCDASLMIAMAGTPAATQTAAKPRTDVSKKMKPRRCFQDSKIASGLIIKIAISAQP
jgi:hypothetical protein